LTISNSLFRQQAGNQPVIWFDQGSTNGTIKNCIIDGNAIRPTAGDASVLIQGSGVFVIEYNFLVNAASDLLDLAPAGGTLTATVKYNLLNNAGMASANFDYHPDYIETAGPSFGYMAFSFNTAYQSLNPPQGQAQGFGMSQAGSLFTAGGEMNFNTWIANPGNAYVTPFFHVALAQINGQFQLNNNYVDPTGLGNSFGAGNFVNLDPTSGPYNGTIVKSGNINMLTGSGI
jgi:hypothetical protein